MAGFSSHSNHFSSPLSNIGAAFQGSNLSSGRDFIFNHGPSQETRREDCIAALFVTNPLHDRQKHITFKGEVTPGTCTWVEQDTTYIKWKESTDKSTQMIWLTAGGGQGKTMLSIYATRELEKWVKRTKGYMLLYYFCDGRDDSRNTAASILRTLIYQMIEKEPSVADIYMKTFVVQRDNLFRSSAIESLWQLFETMVQNCGRQRIYCWIDGIDECKEDSLQHFLKKLRYYFGGVGDSKFQQDTKSPAPDPEQIRSSTGKTSLRMIIVSREAPACLTEELSDFSRVRFPQDPGTKNTKDLQLYISAKAKEVSKSTGGSSTTEQLVANTLQESGDGTFLWVDVATQKLKKSTSGNIHQQLEQLPSSLDEILIRSLINIPPDWVPCVQALLKWVLLAVRPLTLDELRAAIGLLLDADFTYRQLETAISLCGGILSTHQQEVVLSHQSIRNFFLDLKAGPSEHPRLRAFHFNETMMHSELTNACISYLERGALNMQKSMKTLRKVLQLTDCVHVTTADGSTLSEAERNHNAKFPLLKYVVVNWPQHARLGDSNYTNYETRFFAPESSIRDTWWRSYYVSTVTKMAWKIAAPTPFTILHVAAFFGITPLARHVESKGWLWNAMQARDGWSILPIQYALYSGHSDFAYYLIERGASKIPRDSFAQYDESVLEMAVIAGDLRVVDYLLRRGEPVDAKTSTVMSCSDLGKLCWGYTRHYRYWKAWLGDADLDMGSRLFDTDRSLKCSDGCYLIHQAAILGNAPMVQTLLSFGANPNSQSSKAWRPIHDAAWFGYNVIIEILVTGGADVDAKNTTGYTALHCAAHEGQIDCLRKLLGYGLHLEEKTKKGRTALHTASRYGRTAAVELLLNEGADIEATDNDGCRPLLAAILKDKKEVVECLLVRGAYSGEVSMSGANGPYLATLVDVASQNKKKTEILQLLESYYRDPDEFIRASAFSQQSHESSEQLYLTGSDEPCTTGSEHQYAPFLASSSPPRVDSFSSPPPPYLAYSPVNPYTQRSEKENFETYISVTPPFPTNPSVLGPNGDAFRTSNAHNDGSWPVTPPLNLQNFKSAENLPPVSSETAASIASPTNSQEALPRQIYIPYSPKSNATYPPLNDQSSLHNPQASTSNQQATAPLPQRSISPALPEVAEPDTYQRRPSYPPPPPPPPPLAVYSPTQYPPPTPAQSTPAMPQSTTQNSYSPQAPLPAQSAPIIPQNVSQNSYFPQPPLPAQSAPIIPQTVSQNSYFPQPPLPAQSFPPPPPAGFTSAAAPPSPSPYMSPSVAVGPQYLSPTNLSPPLGDSSGTYFAPPPTQAQHQVKKSRSFVDLSIRGKRLL